MLVEVVKVRLDASLALLDDQVSGGRDGGVGHDPVLDQESLVTCVDVVWPLFHHLSHDLYGFFWAASLNGCGW